jgi:hypothetical protein
VSYQGITGPGIGLNPKAFERRHAREVLPYRRSYHASGIKKEKKGDVTCHVHIICTALLSDRAYDVVPDGDVPKYVNLYMPVPALFNV